MFRRVESGVFDDVLVREWDDLADRVGASPFRRPGWFLAWWHAFGAGRLEIHTCRREDGRLCGVLPLTRRRGVLGSLDNGHTFTYGPLAEDEFAAHQLILDAFAQGRRLVLGHLTEADWNSVLSCAAASRYRTVTWVQQRSPYIPVVGDWDSYRQRLDARWLQQLERRRAKLDREGGLAFEVLDGAEDLPRLLAEAFHVEALGWKEREGTAITSHSATLRFYTEVAEWAARRGILRLAFLRLAGQAVAVDICLEGGGIHYFLKTGFDPAYRNRAPGLLLRHDMVRRSFRLGLRAHELLGYDEPYKRRWTDTVREIHRAVAFPPSLTGIVAATTYRRARPIAKRAHARWRAFNGRTGLTRAYG